MLINGLASKTKRSALIPFVSVPNSAALTGGNQLAPIEVAAMIASIGVRPASTYSSNS